MIGKPVIADALAPSAEAQAINAVRDDWQRVSGVSAKLATPTIGGDDALLNEILLLSRKKNGRAEVASRLATIKGVAIAEAQNKSDDYWMSRLKESQQQIADRIVCGFIAEVEAVQAQHCGLPQQMTFSVSSFNVLKIVDALNRAGYTAGGRVSGAERAEKREALMAKTHADVNYAQGRGSGNTIR